MSWLDEPTAEPARALDASADAPRPGVLAGFAEPLANGGVSNWNVCDRYATKTLHTLVAADVVARADPVAAWSAAPVLWQRRVALVVDDRFAHTGPGWALRELCRAVPTASRGT